MSEPISAEISIGGKIPRRLVSRLRKVITQQCVALEWGDGPFRPTTAEDLLASLSNEDGTQVLVLRDDQANWGQFAQLEAFLRRHKISFDRQSDGKYEYSPEVICYRPGRKSVALLTTPSGEPVVTAASIAQVCNQLDVASLKLGMGLVRTGVRRLDKVIRDLRRLLPPDIPTLTPFEIV